MGKKDKRTKRVKKEIVYRTKEERQKEVKEILEKLSNFDLNLKYEPIKKGSRIEINIPFPEINRRIKGILAISVREEVWINLKNEKFN